MNTKHTILLLSMAFFTACSEHLEEESPDSKGVVEDLVPVEFAVSDHRTIDFTRAATNIVTFNASEIVKVFVKPDGSPSYTGYNYTTASAGQSVSLTIPPTPPYFPPGVGTTVEAYAYYPSTATTSFSVATDQTSDANYKASDLMYADNRTITKDLSNGNNHLDMAHQMAQLRITVTPQLGSGITIAGVEVDAKTDVTFDPDPSAIQRVTTTGTVGTITALNAQGTGYIVIPPQIINGVTIRVITGSGAIDEIATYAFTGTGYFESGNSYGLDLTISSDQLGLTTAINNWNGVGSVNITPSGNLAISAIAAQEHTGSALEPTFTVTKDGAPFDPSNYDVSYVNNIDAGKAYVIVHGKGSYADCVGMTTFTITPANGKLEYVETAPGTTAVTKTYGNPNFTNPLLNHRIGDVSTPADGVVTYASTNPSVATVNSATGEVTLLKSGTTTITATATNGANYVYSIAAGDNTASYDLTVNKAAGSISFGYPTPSQTWSPTPANNTYPQTVTHTGDATVTYAIGATNTCGATINSSTGIVTFTKSGTVEVTATVADTDCYSYASKTASYTLTINKATGFITLSESSGTVDAGNTKSFTILTNHGGTLSAVDISGNGRATPTISGTTVNIATTNGSASSANIRVTCDETDCYTTFSTDYALTINAGTAIMKNPLWYMAKTNCAGPTSFVNDEIGENARGVKFSWATSLSYFTTSSVSITGYHRGEKQMTGGLNNYTGDTWHMPTLQEWLSIFGFKGGRYSSGNSLFNHTIPAANTVVDEDQCVFGYNSTTKIAMSYKAYWGTYTNNSNVRYAIRFLGTPYCSIWKYQLDPSNKLCIVSSKLIAQINEDETGKLSTTMSNMSSVDWTENEATGAIQRKIYWAGYNSDLSYGHFWVATEDDASDAYNMLFLSNWLGQSDLNTKTCEMSTRLFRDN